MDQLSIQSLSCTDWPCRATRRPGKRLYERGEWTREAGGVSSRHLRKAVGLGVQARTSSASLPGHHMTAPSISSIRQPDLDGSHIDRD